MDLVALISGGKDSCYNLMCALKAGHKIKALATLCPPANIDELDSYMYQSIGTRNIQVYADAMGVPLYMREITGTPLSTSFDYAKTPGDEVEDLFELLKTVLELHPSIKGVSVGAIHSDYQTNRVKNVAARLGLSPIALLWRRDQDELLDEMIREGVHAVLVKVAAAGLNAQHLGKSIEQMQPILRGLHKKFDVSVCGEGGEFESFVLDCPLFKRRIVVVASADDVAPVAYLRLMKLRLEDKQ